MLGRCAEAAGDEAEAAARYTGAAERHERLGNAVGAADCLDRLGRLAAEAGRWSEAETRFAAALARYEALGSERGVATALRLGAVRARVGDPAGAWNAVARVQSVGRHLDRAGHAVLVHALRLVRSAVEADWPAWDEALALTAATLPRKGQAPGLVASLGEVAADLARHHGEHERAAVASRAALAIWTAGGEVGRAAAVAARLES